ncbi:LamG-like jellyroll fold domain-containing protein [Streptomyces sp. NPDC058662]|uniref:LamG-like jellyroll fold domain-containing protein n=1 Tax=Streptomyces sp. NPDC058662 TaxID=3346583 RepID=UPI003661EB1F
MTDGTNPPSNQQPEPAPGGGGYGFPPGPPASGGYGFPPGPPISGGGYGYPPGPAGSGGFGPAPTGSDSYGYGYPQGGPAGPYQGQPDPSGPPEPAAFSPTPQPNWEAMADRAGAERRRKRLWAIVGSTVAVALLAGGGAFLLLRGDGSQEGKDLANEAPPSSGAAESPSAGGTAKPYSPVVATDPSLLRDSNGKVHMRMGPEATVPKADSHFELRLTGSPNSYAQGTKPAVNTAKSFSLSARVYNTSTAKGPQIVLSQGAGDSFSFELGADTVNGAQAWVFRVRTTDKGATPTVVTVAAEGVETVKTWTVLTAVHDAKKKTISLYVEGKKAGEAPIAGIHKNDGPSQLGRARHQNAWAGAWKGSIHHVRLYGAAFSPEQAAGYRNGTLDAPGRSSQTSAYIVG